MRMESEVDLREQQFHDTIRENLVSSIKKKKKN
jgi:hypothetical protein